MAFSEIKKDPLSAFKNNLVNYQDTYTHFTWQQAQQRIAGSDQGFNIAYEALELDSMDFLNLVIAVSKRSQVALPETDYAKVLTLNAMISYLMDHA